MEEIVCTIEKHCGPERRTIATAPGAMAVAIATIVSVIIGFLPLQYAGVVHRLSVQFHEIEFCYFGNIERPQIAVLEQENCIGFLHGY